MCAAGAERERRNRGCKSNTPEPAARAKQQYHVQSGTAEAVRVPPACHQAPWRTRQPRVLVCPPYAYQGRHRSS
eukprot:10982423-Alexandrium_andersonii.AAC.1